MEVKEHKTYEPFRPEKFCNLPRKYYTTVPYHVNYVYFEMAQIIFFVILKMICWVLGALSTKVERWKYKINLFSKWYKQFIALFPDNASIIT